MDGQCFYIGITENPSRRFDEHLASGGHWVRHVVLVQAPTSRTTSSLERDLLVTYGNVFGCLNASAGGERASAGSPHFLYLLVGQDSLLRRPSSGRQ